MVDPVESYLAKSIEDVVEEDQDFTFGHLGNVVHAFAGIISYPGVLIGEACQHRRYNLLQVSSDFILSTVSRGWKEGEEREVNRS